MSDIIRTFLSDILLDAFSQFDLHLNNMLKTIFYIEQGFGAVLSSSMVENVYHFIYYFMLSLLAAKFLNKGFQIYILWRNGDADNSPQDMLIGAGQAVAISICFPYVYDKLTDVTLWLADGIMTNFTLSSGAGLEVLSDTLSTCGIVQIIIMLIYTILSIVLHITLLARGLELLIIRLGMPIACIGLLDSDYGIFQPIMQTLFKTMMTSIIQICLFALSFRILISFNLNNVLLGIACISAAFKTPLTLQNMLIPTHGGGGMSKVYQGAQLGRIIAGLARR